MSEKSVVIAYSGGGDSTTLLYKAHKEFDKVYTISFDYGQRHKKELEYVKWNIDNLPGTENKIVELSFLSLFKGCSLTDRTIEVEKAKDMIGDPQPKQYFFCRNTIFLSILTGYAESIGCNTVWYGAAAADSIAGYYDGSQDFVNKINELNALNRRHKITIEAPLITLNKEEIIELGISVGVNWEKAWTCYSGGDLSCGVCPACSLRLNGFLKLKKRDPLIYQNQDKLEGLYTQNNCLPITG